MINTTLLKKYIKTSGYKMNYLAEQLGLTRNGFALKRDGVHQFTVEEAMILCDLLGIRTMEEYRLIFSPVKFADSKPSEVSA